MERCLRVLTTSIRLGIRYEGFRHFYLLQTPAILLDKKNKKQKVGEQIFINYKKVFAHINYLEKFVDSLELYF